VAHGVYLELNDNKGINKVSGKSKHMATKTPTKRKGISSDKSTKKPSKHSSLSLMCNIMEQENFSYPILTGMELLALL